MTEVSTTKSAISRIGGMILATLLLIVLPAMSYMYLSKGWAYRKQVQAELRNYGKINPAMATLPDGSVVDQLDGCVTVIHAFLPNTDLTPDNQRVIDLYKGLYEQFGYKTAESNPRAFRLALAASNSTPAFQSHVRAIPNGRRENWVWLNDYANWSAMLQQGLEQYCREEKMAPFPNWVAVSDTSGTIRRFYNIDQPETIQRMIHQINLLMPQ
jgi:hypothetical protein